MFCLLCCRCFLGVFVLEKLGNVAVTESHLERDLLLHIPFRDGNELILMRRGMARNREQEFALL